MLLARAGTWFRVYVHPLQLSGEETEACVPFHPESAKGMKQN